jgi:signal transduction histidine kinase
MAAPPARRRTRSLRVELLLTLAMVLAMAEVAMSFVGAWSAQERHEARERERLSLYAAGVAQVAALHVVPALVLDAEGNSRIRLEIDHGALGSVLEQARAPSLGVYTAEIWSTMNGEPERIAAAGIPDELGPPRGDRSSFDESERERSGLVGVIEPLPLAPGTSTGGRVVLRLVAEPAPWIRSDEMLTTILTAVGVSTVLLVLGGLMLEALVLGPLRELQRAAERVAAGDLQARVPEDGPQELVQLVRAFNDMTESLSRQRDELAEQGSRLQRSEQLATVGRLAAGVAHEVGNPLAAVKGYVDFLLDPRTSLDPAAHGLVERVREQTVRIQDIVGQLLALSRPGRGNVVTIDVRKEIDAAAELLRVDARTHGVEIRTRGRDTIEALADPAVLQQVLLNLGVNAALATKETRSAQPTVELRAGVDADGHAWIEVQDDGPGVAPEVRDTLFQPFVTTRPAGQGTGLGLAISLGLCEAMNARLALLSEDSRPALHEGGRAGATFRITLGPRPDDGRVPSGDT